MDEIMWKMFGSITALNKFLTQCPKWCRCHRWMMKLPLCRTCWIQPNRRALCDPSKRQPTIDDWPLISKCVLGLHSRRWPESCRTMILLSKSNLKGQPITDYSLGAGLRKILASPLLWAFNIAYCSCPFSGVNARMIPSFQAEIILLPS